MAVNLDPKNMLNYVVQQGNGVKGLVETGLSKVPEQYIQLAHERITTNATDAPAPPLPVVDLSGLDGPQHDEVVEALVKAAKTFGFFQLVNHGLPVQSLEDSTRYFFNQPAEKKMVYHKGVSPSPSVTYGTSFAPEEEKVFEWVDTLTMTYNDENDDEDARKHWPDPCKEVVLNHLKTSTVLAKRILQFLLKNVGVTLDNSETNTYMGAKMITMNFYPPCPEPDLTIGLGRHSDFGTITVLLQDDVGGLFVKLENDGDDESKEATWVEITPIPGALVIIVGDSLEILSNGEYKSPEHWVRTSNTKSRISIPVFLGPILTAKIGPLPEVAEKDGGPRYKENVFGEYVGYAYTQPAQGKAILNSMKISQGCEI